jgi:hypothetical protein
VEEHQREERRVVGGRPNEELQKRLRKRIKRLRGREGRGYQEEEERDRSDTPSHEGGERENGRLGFKKGEREREREFAYR